MVDDQIVADRITLESRIQQEISKDSKCTVSFQYLPTKIKVFTYNTVTQEFFLLLSMPMKSEGEIKNGSYTIDTLLLMSDYLESHKIESNSYTVEWSKKKSTVKNTSYFYCENVRQVIDRFFDTKDPDGYIIYNIKLNPVA